MSEQAKTNEVLIRAADESDADSIAAIYNWYVDTGGSTFDARHWTVREVTKQIAAPDPDGWFVADRADDESILGWAAAHRFSGRHGYRHSCETAIYIRDHAFGSGVADALQTKVEQHCQRVNIHHLMAKIIADNTRSIAFHRRHGYETVGVQKEIGRMQGRWVDVEIMQKLLS